MKKFLMVFLAGLMIMPLAAGCGSKKKVEYDSTFEALKSAFVNDHVYFDFDRYDIRPQGAAIIQAKADFMSRYPVTAEIQGHCDERGTEVYNMALGDRRARATYNYITSFGSVDGSRLTTVSYGKERPLDPSHNEAAWARNRRAQFVITGGGY